MNIERPRLPNFSKKFFLSLSAIGVCASLGGLVPGEIRIGIEAAIARQTPNGVDPYCEKLSSLEPNFDQTLKDTYAEHFKGNEQFMPYSAWSYESQKFNDYGVGHRIAVLAQLYYSKDRTQGETFSNYYKRFLRNLHAISDQTDLNFAVLVNTLKVSGENIQSEAQKKDTRMSQVQQGVMPLLLAFGLEDQFNDLAGPGGRFAPFLNSILGKDCHGNTSVEENKSNYYDLIRMRSAESTTGMMDFEPGERARAYMVASPKLKQEFDKRYPSLSLRYTEFLASKTELNSARVETKQLTIDYLSQNPEALRIFAQGDKDALAQIGIGQPIDSWQLKNFTFTWKEAIKTQDMISPAISNQTIRAIKEAADENYQKFAYDFMSQQFMNPKFLPYLRKQAEMKDARSEKQQLDLMETLRVKISEKTQKSRESVRKILATEGALEVDSYFQQLSAVMITNMLSLEAGPFDPNDLNSTVWHIYKLIAIREIAPPELLINGPIFAKDATIDPPYSPKEVLDKIDEFTKIMQDKGLLSEMPNKDVISFINSVNALRFPNQNTLSQLSPQERKSIMKYFENNFVSVLYINNLSFHHTAPNNPEFRSLSDLLVSKGLLSERPEDNMSKFYALIINLHEGNDYLYPEVSPDDIDMVKKFIATTVFAESGIYRTDYPPIVRSQGVAERAMGR